MGHSQATDVATTSAGPTLTKNANVTRRTPNPKGQGSRLREELLEAANRVLAKGGHAALTLRAVAREANVTAPAIYLHFKDIEELTWDLLLLTWRELAAEMEAADDAVAEQGPLARLEAQLAAYVDFATSNPTRYELLFAITPDPERVRIAYGSPTIPVYQALERAVSRCHDAGYELPLPRGDAPDPSTVLLFVAAHGRIALGAAVQRMPFASHESAHHFVREVIHNLVVPPKDKRRR